MEAAHLRGTADEGAVGGGGWKTMGVWFTCGGG